MPRPGGVSLSSTSGGRYLTSWVVPPFCTPKPPITNLTCCGSGSHLRRRTSGPPSPTSLGHCADVRWAAALGGTHDCNCLLSLLQACKPGPFAEFRTTINASWRQNATTETCNRALIRSKSDQPASADFARVTSRMMGWDLHSIAHARAASPAVNFALGQVPK